MAHQFLPGMERLYELSRTGKKRGSCTTLQFKKVDEELKMENWNDGMIGNHFPTFPTFL